MRYLERTSNHHRRRKQLLDQITSAQIRLHDKLLKLDLQLAGISEYNQRYLGDKVSALRSQLQLYGHLIYLSVRRSSVSPEHFVIVDYGGGSGMLSFLAKEMGIGTVIYNDIYDTSCKDVNLLSSILELPLDHVICGDINEIISYLQRNGISINAIISYDVLEHIYDVESHFKKLGSLSDGQFRVVYASGANMQNQSYVRGVTSTQIEAEYKSREKKWGDKERDSLRAFFDVRKEIISNYPPGLSSEQVEELSRSTRGLIQSDIEKCVDEYRQKGSITYRPDHPTNTCDPYTGNWCEHLMDTGWLKQILEDVGFFVEILPGPYPLSGSLLRNIAKSILNAAIQLLGRRAMFAAPYYIVYANRCGGQY